METLTIILIALSISADAFSLSLAYALMNIKNKKLYISLLVGLFHFLMPLFGLYIGYMFIDKIPINPKFIVAAIFILILFEMIKSLYDKKEEFDLNLINIIFFSFIVSVDSFSIGLGLQYITNTPIKACIVFSIFSMFFTYLGFSLGKFISKKIGKISKIIGIVLLISLILYYLCK